MAVNFDLGTALLPAEEAGQPDRDGHEHREGEWEAQEQSGHEGGNFP